MRFDAQAASEYALRASVAFAFLFPPIDAWFNPYSWLGYIPAFLHGLLPGLVLLHGFGAVEIILALWLLFGRRVAAPAALCAFMLLAIVFFNRNDFEVLFRDVALAAASLSLALLHVSRPRVS